jgi:four helix bundle protein
MHDHTTLEAWREATAVSVEVYRLAARRWTPEARYAFDQLRRSSLSIRLNLAEGYVSRPSPRWRNHVKIALGSAGETRDAVTFLMEVDAISVEEGTKLINQIRKTERLLWGFIRPRAGT